MRKVAIVGSRLGIPEQRVALAVNAVFEKVGEFILVSGGSDGVCRVAEVTANEFGLPIISFHVEGPLTYGTDEFYRVDEWRMHRGSGAVIQGEITWKDWQSATNWKALLIAERAERAVALWNGQSRGTAFEIECFEHAGVPYQVMK